MDTAVTTFHPRHPLHRLATAAEMRAMDAHAIEQQGLPARLLMENAAAQVADTVCELMGEAQLGGSVVVCCGAGNNGGDGYAAARHLENRGVSTVVVETGLPKTPDAVANRAALIHVGDCIDWGEHRVRAEAAVAQAQVIVDALFGTGLTRPIEGDAAALVEAINASPAPVKLAVDIASGIHSDTGALLGAAVRCTHTLALQVAKLGHHQHPGRAYAGQVRIAPISISLRWPVAAPPTYVLERDFVADLLPERPVAGHKGTFGHLLAVCGSAGMGGAAGLAGMGALRVGAGLVTLGVPRCLRDRYVAIAPELMTLAGSAGDEAHFDAPQVAPLLAAAGERNALVLGCGLGRHAATGEFVRDFVAQAAAPLLIDADGLYFLDGAQLRARGEPTVITPHPGELSRLSGLSVADLSADRVGHARRLAAEWGVVLVLKGAGTVVAAPDGSAYINTTGDQGLASGGTGDVLSGMIGGLMAQGLAPLAAALAGVYLHGLARDLRSAERTTAAFVASDLVGGIDAALRCVAGP
jgi:NAD(P)H-hydrate epimerase